MALGFDAVGFAPATGDPAWSRDLTAYVAQGRHGTMDWMGIRMDQRAAPRALWPEARSVIVLGTNYAPAENPLASPLPGERGLISVYARHKDYHDLIKRRLKSLARWLVTSPLASSGAPGVKVFVDTAPVMEKPLAQAGGLGWRGKHTNLVSRDWGSWLLLGEIFTTLEISPDSPGMNRCGRCRACVDICPTQALDGEGRIEPRRCISYLTIEHDGPIPEALRPLMGNHVYGCDDCLAVCPWNKFAIATREADFLPRIELTAPRLADLADLNDADFREVFAASPIKRIGLRRMVRNALTALGNSGRPDLAAAAGRRMEDPDPVIRDAAAWAVSRLTGG